MLQAIYWRASGSSCFSFKGIMFGYGQQLHKSFILFIFRASFYALFGQINIDFDFNPRIRSYSLLQKSGLSVVSTECPVGSVKSFYHSWIATSVYFGMAWHDFWHFHSQELLSCRIMRSYKILTYTGKAQSSS